MKRIIRILPIVIVMCILVTSVFAVSVPTTNPTGGTVAGSVTTVAANLWATIASVIQLLAIAAVVFAGLKYMFASADQKADIKKGLGILALGAVMVFGSVTLLKMFTDII